MDLPPVLDSEMTLPRQLNVPKEDFRLALRTARVQQTRVREAFTAVYKMMDLIREARLHWGRIGESVEVLTEHVRSIMDNAEATAGVFAWPE